ncbi:hypothetical protein JCM19240_418 [Vibrio maritimus]|uniref:Uncharacterized protein n=1 Tax=Vibrio maritimus TaxID=990268 RepID=A0A090T6M1_9VIBR|nr:hypothetical protein JCM19240_418 [Vibrio maritimus]
MKTTILVILSLFCAAVIAQDSDITVTGETFEIQVGSKSGDRVVGTLVRAATSQVPVTASR